MAIFGDECKNHMASIAVHTNHVDKVAYMDYVLCEQSETGQFGMWRVILIAREVNRNVSFYAHLI